MDFFTRLHEDRDVPFRPEDHNWLAREEYVRPERGHFSYEVCFRAVEEALMADDQKLLKTALFAELGKRKKKDFSDFTLQQCSATLIQQGAQEAIFHVKVRVTCGSKEKEISFVAAASRHPLANPLVQINHEVITAMRSSEAQAFDLNPDSKEYAARSTFPKHYGSFQTQSGPYVYVSEFCDGYFEVNLRYSGNPRHVFAGDDIERTILLNGTNQGNRRGRALDLQPSAKIIGEIGMHQMETAVRCHIVLGASFEAGDYLYHPEEERLMLQCFRDPKIGGGSNSVWPTVAAVVDPRKDPNAYAAAFQLMQLATFREGNSGSFREYSADEHFTYSFVELSAIVDRLRENSKFLKPKQWRMVAQILDFFSQYISTIPIPPKEQRFLYDRFTLLKILAQKK